MLPFPLSAARQQYEWAHIQAFFFFRHTCNPDQKFPEVLSYRYETCMRKSKCWSASNTDAAVRTLLWLIWWFPVPFLLRHHVVVVQVLPQNVASWFLSNDSRGTWRVGIHGTFSTTKTNVNNLLFFFLHQQSYYSPVCSFHGVRSYSDRPQLLTCFNGSPVATPYLQ